MPVVKCWELGVKQQLERKGFIFSGQRGDGINRKAEYCLVGDIKKISAREKPYIHVVGLLKEKARRDGVAFK